MSPAATLIAHEPFWLTLVKVVAVFGFLMLMTLFTIVAERKVVGRMQQRIGPLYVGWHGSLQSLADGVKLMLKEDIIPALADRPVFILAPIVSAVPAFLAWSVIPLGGTVSIAGHHTPLQLADLDVGVLWALACSGLGVYGIVLAGWASGSTYPLLGGLRSAAQMISYEISMGLSMVAVFLFSGTLTSSGVVAQQGHPLWYAVTLLPSFLIYAVAAVGETNRAPFDLPEAESELVGGFHTEYSSIKFAFFFLAEYINMVTVCAVATTLFLGGPKPWPLLSLIPGADNPWLGIVWFLSKVLLGLFVFIWLRGTLPRLRYDQFMHLGWKVLVPASLVWIVAVSLIRARSNGTISTPVMVGLLAALVVAVALVVGLTGRRTPAPDLAGHGRPIPLDRIPAAPPPVQPQRLPVPAPDDSRSRL